MLRLRSICLISILCSITISLRASDDMTSFPVSTPIAEYSFQKGMLLNFGWDNFALQADSGALLHDLELSFELLREEQVPRMPSYMVNVTGDNVGAYRLLPNGVHFEEAATITVPYDEYLLPMGYKAKDVKTYYFDEELAQWKHTNNAKSEFSASFVGKKRGFFDKNAVFFCRIRSFFVILHTFLKCLQQEKMFTN